MMAQRLVAQRLSLSLALAARHGRQRPTTRTARSSTRVTAFAMPTQQSWIHSTRSMRTEEDVANKDTATGIIESQDDDDECPVWQNPLHHNNPELEKMFPEDFAEGEVMPLVPLPPLARPGSRVQAPPHVHELCDEIVQLNMLEVKELMDKIAVHFGFDPHAIAMGLGGGGGMASTGGKDDEEKEEVAVVEKTAFDIRLVGFDAKNKIKVIKEVRAIAGLGLKEAKELVESAPTVIKKDVKKEEAHELQKKLEEIGATIEVV